jgi:hypothetical protein
LQVLYLAPWLLVETATCHLQHPMTLWQVQEAS